MIVRHSVYPYTQIMKKPFYTVDEARALASRRQPRMMFDFIDGAAGAERTAQRNRELLDSLLLQPRVLKDITQLQLSKRFLDQSWALPFGIAPMGMCDLAWPGTDLALAEVARTANIPLTLSTAASTSIETMYPLAGESLWFQLYVGQSIEQAMSLVDRAAKVGCDVLVLTVDAQRVGVRPRDLRNGFKTPIQIGLREFVDFATHPRWSVQTLLAGVPRTANFSADQGDLAFKRESTRGKVDATFLAQLRHKWQGKLVVKGVMSAVDAELCVATGADALWVSNHGGRQLDSAPAAITQLRLIRETVGHAYPLIFDSGIRSGEDVVKALATGADFVMLGRPFLYAAGAAGALGVSTLVDVMNEQISQSLAQLACANINDIDSQVLAQ